MEAGFQGPVVLASESAGLRGATIHTANLARELARRGISVTLVSPSEAFFAEAVGGDVDLWVCPGLRSWVGRLLARKGLLEELSRTSPAVLHLHGIEHLKFWHGVAGQLGCRFVATATRFVRKRIWDGSGVARGTRFLVMSEDARANLVNVGRVPKGMVQIAASGVACSDRGEDEGAATVERVVATMGSLEERKGLETLLAAAQKLEQRGLEFQMLIIGSGPLERTLRRLRSRLGLTSKVVFAPGTAAYGEMLWGIDIFVLPSVSQPLGQTMLEAMVRGKPVVASGVGGIYSVLADREHGLIVKSEDVDELADNIAKLLDDETLRRELGEAARKRACEEFGIGKAVDRLLAIYADNGS